VKAAYALNEYRQTCAEPNAKRERQGKCSEEGQGPSIGCECTRL
jgi:hypothetical protein